MSEPVFICRIEDLEVGEAKRFDIDGTRLAAVRVSSSEVNVIGDRCSHANFSLAEGEVDLEAGTIECWKHGALFSLTEGVAVCLPATKPVPVYKAVVSDGDVKVVLS